MNSKRKLIISDELKSVLQSIHKKSSIAQMLISDIDTNLLVDDPIDHLSLAHGDYTKISYLNSERYNKLDESDIWTTGRRFSARPGAVIHKIFNDNSGITGRDIELFGLLYKSEVTVQNYEMKVVSGNDILKYYFYDNYYTNGGSLGSSCMKGSNQQDFLKIYCDNPDTIELLVMLNEGKVMGRALLWKLPEHKVMDRIYTINDEELSFYFKKWAENNSYIYKQEQKWQNTLHFETDGHVTVNMFEVKLSSYLYKKYPYVDTFKFLDDEKGILYNYIPHTGVKTLASTDGGHLNGDYFVQDVVTNMLYYTGDTIYIDYINGRTHQTNTVWSTCNDRYLLKRDSKYIEEADDYIFNEDNDHLNNVDSIKNLMDKIEAIRLRKENEAKLKKSLMEAIKIDQERRAEERRLAEERRAEEATSGNGSRITRDIRANVNDHTLPHERSFVPIYTTFETGSQDEIPDIYNTF